MVTSHERTSGAVIKWCLDLCCLAPPSPTIFLGMSFSHSQAHVLEFMCDIFSLDSVRYTTVHTLADDILLLAQHTAQSLIVE